MNKFSELITNRRSIRRFTTEKIESKHVELVLRAALMSPSSRNIRPWHFIAIENKETLSKLSECRPAAKQIKDCALAVVVTGDSLASDVWVEDCTIAATMMQLQAEELGLGSCWVQVRERYADEDFLAEDYIKNILDLPMQLHVLSIIIFGYKDENKPPHKNEDLLWEKIHIDKF
ncbi:nitroreductase [Dysgonomonas sp. PH5-45]|uniref:nitroreductase family protein n=1 Tax=unclassified Dysgonomonas TaxID=2630389 RepID=UPI002476423B|nr:MULTISPECIES: nitroreductase family protein [unclassified Dysgonomonas]MDH6353912.1 nitroreductase [Dysgonomonas sp. PH5-45]MDH6386814.1 nitroreductase [Dysgonomonas sp. PH5-37]